MGIKKTASSTKNSILLFLIIFLLIDCASYKRPKRIEQFRAYLESMVNIMTYHRAKKKWGEPSSVVKKDKVFVATWRLESGGSAYTETLSGMVLYEEDSSRTKIAGRKSTGFQLQLTFDNKSRRMMNWRFNYW